MWSSAARSPSCRAIRPLAATAASARLGLAVAEVLRSRAPLSAERKEYWLSRVTSEEAALEPSLALPRSAYRERQGAHDQAVAVLRWALRSEGISHDPTGAKALTTELARLDRGSGGLVRRMSRGWRTWLALALAAACCVSAAAVVIVGGPRPSV